jgi:hypothetical protein
MDNNSTPLSTLQRDSSMTLVYEQVCLLKEALESFKIFRLKRSVARWDDSQNKSPSPKKGALTMLQVRKLILVQPHRQTLDIEPEDYPAAFVRNILKNCGLTPTRQCAWLLHQSPAVLAVLIPNMAAYVIVFARCI